MPRRTRIVGRCQATVAHPVRVRLFDGSELKRVGYRKCRRQAKHECEHTLADGRVVVMELCLLCADVLFPQEEEREDGK